MKTRTVEVVIRKQSNGLLVVPITMNDPILQLGTQPIADEVSDASTNHDRSLRPMTSPSGAEELP